MVTINTDELTSYGDVECIGPAGEAFSLQTRVEAVLKVRREAKIEGLKAEHEQLVLQRREHGKALNALRTEQGEIQFGQGEIERSLSKAVFDLRMLRDQAPNEPFTLRAELEAFNEKVAEAEKKVRMLEQRRFDKNGALAPGSRERPKPTNSLNG